MSEPKGGKYYAEKTQSKVVVASRETDYLPTGQIDALAVWEEKYGALKTQLDELEAQKDEIRAHILVEFEARWGHEGHSFVNPETGGVLQRVLQVRQEADNDKLRKVLTPEEWAMVKMEKVDIVKLLAAIKIGAIKPNKIQDGLVTKEIEKLNWKAGKKC